MALPVTVKTLDAEHVSRFQAELSLSDARPLYFCDTDGTRAGILWYVRRVTKDKVDPQVAAREAEQMGLIDNPFWRAATDYIEGRKPAPAVPPQPPAPGAAPAAPAGPVAFRLGRARAGPEVADAAPAPASSARSGDPAAWQSYAAMMITGLGLPLAYWGRASLPSFRGRARASLAAPARRAKSLPSSSDE